MFLFIRVYDLRGGSPIILLSAIDLAIDTPETWVRPEPSPTNVVAVMIPTEAFVTDKNPTVEIPVTLTFPDETIFLLEGIVAPWSKFTKPSPVLFVIESVLRLKLMI